MEAIRLNHVSICAIDLEESVAFYVSLLGLERIPTYSHAYPAQYLKVGEQQLHIFERPTSAHAYLHFGLEVDDFESVYLRAKELDILDFGAFDSFAYELPDGSVQLYLRDPAGNLVELDCPDGSTLDPETMGELPKLADVVPQTPEADGATLFLTDRSEDPR